jgi:RNA polymerase sigma-70 factor (ECF subfamily)
MLLSGKTMAFSHFIEQNAPRVCSAVRAILGNQDEADKIAQQVFVTAWFTAKGRDTWRLPYAWIYRIVVSECYGYLRMKRLEPSVDGTLDRVHQQRDLLNQALERVPDEDRYLLLLRELEGYSVTQLSEATKLDESTIKKRLFEARQRLARNLTRNLRP